MSQSCLNPWFSHVLSVMSLRVSVLSRSHLSFTIRVLELLSQTMSQPFLNQCFNLYPISVLCFRPALNFPGGVSHLVNRPVVSRHPSVARFAPHLDVLANMYILANMLYMLLTCTCTYWLTCTCWLTSTCTYC